MDREQLVVQLVCLLCLIALVWGIGWEWRQQRRGQAAPSSKAKGVCTLRPRTPDDCPECRAGAGRPAVEPPALPYYVKLLPRPGTTVSGRFIPASLDGALKRCALSPSKHVPDAGGHRPGAGSCYRARPFHPESLARRPG